MQCSNCRFENMPGIQACGRCGASLQLASLAIDVNPPRAARSAKRWRRWFPVARYWSRVRSAVANSRAAKWLSGLPERSLLLRMIVPGWAQRHAGRLARARWMFGSYVGLLLAGLLFVGTPLGWLLVGLAVAVHAASVLDFMAATVADVGQRLAYSAVTLLALLSAVYYPAGWLLSQFAAPDRFVMAAFPFRAGDVVLVNRSAYWWSEPQLGDVVSFDLRPQTIVPEFTRGTVYRSEGRRIDRVIARAGQRVAVSEGKLLVDGQLSAWLPLNPQRLPEGWDFVVPEGCCAICPSGDPIPYPSEVLQAVSIVSREHIRGRVYWRHQPLWRFGPIR
jgi:signal peptidase I